MDRRTALRLAGKAIATGALGAGGGWAYTAVAAERLAGLTTTGRASADVRPDRAWAPSATALRTAALTPDGGDRYDVVTDGDRVAVSAPASNGGGNLRVVLWRATEPASIDHSAAATFVADDHQQQPGLALRIDSGGSRTRAVTVTKNIWGRAYWTFNVHVMDSAAPEPFRQIGSFDLSERLRTPDGLARPYPWRMRAQVIGTTVRFSVWTPWEAPPGWDDRARGGQVVLPPGWDAPGRPGLYAGHLPAGRSLSYTSVTTRFA